MGLSCDANTTLLQATCVSCQTFLFVFNIIKCFLSYSLIREHKQTKRNTVRWKKKQHFWQVSFFFICKTSCWCSRKVICLFFNDRSKTQGLWCMVQSPYIFSSCCFICLKCFYIFTAIEFIRRWHSPERLD